MGVPLLADEKGPEKYLTEKRRVFFSNCKKMMLAKKVLYTVFVVLFAAVPKKIVLQKQ